MLLLLLLALPAVVQAQFNYTITNGTVTITGYTGPGGAVDIPSTIASLPVTSIGGHAFAGCPLTTVTIPNSVTSLGAFAFNGCSRLTSVMISSSVTTIGDSAFWYCISLTAITVDPQNTNYSSVDGVLFNHSQTTLITYPEGKAGAYTIPNTVTSIGNSAFYYCNGLTNVTIPNSVTSIGDRAFLECYGLTNVPIPNSVTSIGDFAFSYCTSLTSVTIPNSVTNMGNYYAFSECTGLTNVTIGNSVTSIGPEAFYDCTNLASVTIPNSVTTIEEWAFANCYGLTNVPIPNSVTSIGLYAFGWCESLTSITIGNGITNIGNCAFAHCWSLRGVYFLGNAPSAGLSLFYIDGIATVPATVYYLPGTTGWGSTFGGRPTALWTHQVPTIQTPPQTQTAEAGSAVGLQVEASSPLPLFYFWYLNATNLLSSGSNWQLDLPNVQLAQSGAYTVVISNVLGAVTCGPVMLNVIAAVERRPVWGVNVTGQAGSLLNLDYADSLSPAPIWTTLGSVSLTGTPQYCFFVTLPLPPQRFYRAWQTGTPGVMPSLGLHLVPAITLAGSIGHSVRLDYINQFGPIDAWVTLDTVTLTNTSQLYFDISAPGQPQRLYRLVPSP